MEIHIMRGPSGSGKSTYHKEKWPDAEVCSADNFFMVEGPDVAVDNYCYPVGDPRRIDITPGESVYKFDPSKLGEAHSVCLSNFIDLLWAGTSILGGDQDAVIVVDNTFTTLWELNPYLAAIQLAGRECHTTIHEFHVGSTDALRFCAESNTHGTPMEVVAKMAFNFEAYRGSMVEVERILSAAEHLTPYQEGIMVSHPHF